MIVGWCCRLESETTILQGIDVLVATEDSTENWIDLGLEEVFEESNTHRQGWNQETGLVAAAVVVEFATQTRMKKDEVAKRHSRTPVTLWNHHPCPWALTLTTARMYHPMMGLESKRLPSFRSGPLHCCHCLLSLPSRYCSLFLEHCSGHRCHHRHSVSQCSHHQFRHHHCPQHPRVLLERNPWHFLPHWATSTRHNNTMSFHLVKRQIPRHCKGVLSEQRSVAISMIKKRQSVSQQNLLTISNNNGLVSYVHCSRAVSVEADCHRWFAPLVAARPC